MPYPTAVVTKRTLRQDVAALLGDNLPVLTTSGGSSTTAIASSLIGMPIVTVQNKYLLLESGTYDSEYRIASSFAPTTGTITVRRAYSGTVATAVSAHLHEFSPEIYTRAINEALLTCYPAAYRPVLHHTFVRQPSTQRTIPLPRGMERVMRIMECARPSEVLRDYFNRTANASSPGTAWTNSVGTFGVILEVMYGVSDANADLVLAATNPQLKNGVIQATVQGTLNSGVTYRTPSLVFRYDDSGGDYLLVRLLNGSCDLRKIDGGTESSLTTASLTTADGVRYVIRVMFDGSWVRVWVDDIEVIQYELIGLNLKYLGYDESGSGAFGPSYGNIGVRLDKAGSPATSASVGDYFAHALVGRVERTDWQRTYDGRMIDLNIRNRGWGLSESKMLWLEGMAGLSALAADSTFEALTSDSTATVEIQTTEPAYEILTQWAAYVVLRTAASPAYTASEERRQAYGKRADVQKELAQQVRDRKAMRWQMRAWV